MIKVTFVQYLRTLLIVAIYVQVFVRCQPLDQVWSVVDLWPDVDVSVARKSTRPNDETWVFKENRVRRYIS